MNPEFAVRPAGVEALDDVMRVMNAAFDPVHGEAWSATQCAGALSMPGSILLVATADARVCGFALARTVLDETELLLLGVVPTRRGLGVGAMLVGALIDTVKRSAGRKLYLEVRANNSARAFYARLGFGEVGFRKNYYRGMSGLYTDAVTLALDLKNSGSSRCGGQRIHL